MRKFTALLIALLVPFLVKAQIPVVGVGGVPLTTVAGLTRLNPLTYPLAVVKDGNSSTDCTTGGANTRVTCYYNGSAWAAIASVGSGTVNSGTATHLGYYATSTATISDAGADFTFDGTHTWTLGASGILDLGAATITNVKFNSTGFTNGHLLTVIVSGGAFTFADGGAVPTGTLTPTGTPGQYDGAFWNAGTVVNKISAPTVNGVYVYLWNPVSSAAVAPVANSLAALPAGTVVGSADTGTPRITFAANSIGFNRPVSFASTQLSITGTNGTAPSAPASGSTNCFTETTNGFGCQDSSGNKRYPTGGAGAPFFNVAGPTAARTYTLPDANTTINGIPAVSIDTSTPVTVSTTSYATFYNNQNATAGTAVTYDLPTAAAGKQFCFTNSYNGSAANTGALTLQTSAAGQLIIFTDGTLSADHGYVSSGGAASDAACVVGVDGTHWQLYVQRGTWTKH